jgi:predicted amidohydrolase YtcJ
LTWRPGASKPVEEITRQIEKFPHKTGDGDDWLRFGTYKVTLDGGMTIGTAYQRIPYGPFGRQLYGQTDPASRGQLFVPPDKLSAILSAARKRGWQLTAHSQGGGAIDNLLEAFEGLPGLRESRSHLMHASFQSLEAIRKAARLGVLVDAQPAWLYFDAPALQKVFGQDGMRYFIPLKSMVKAGIVVAGGSDHMTGFDKNRSTNPYNPFHGMWIAVTRRMSDGRVLVPEERLTREEALRMYTFAPAYLNLDDSKKGSIEAGKYADFVVIDRDYMTCPEDEIRAIEPVMTVIGGKVRYRK